MVAGSNPAESIVFVKLKKKEDKMVMENAVKAMVEVTAKSIYTTSEWAEVTVHFPGGGHVRAEGRVRLTEDPDPTREGSVWVGNVCLKESTSVVDYQKNDEYGVFF